MPDLPADSTIDVIALLVAAAGTFVFFLKSFARKRAATSTPKPTGRALRELRAEECGAED